MIVYVRCNFSIFSTTYNLPLNCPPFQKGLQPQIILIYHCLDIT
jgi:hypothetical protein